MNNIYSTSRNKHVNKMKEVMPENKFLREKLGASGHQFF